MVSTCDVKDQPQIEIVVAKAVEKFESERQMSGVRRDILSCARRRTRRFARAENRHVRIAVVWSAVTRFFHIAENLIVSSIFADDVNNMFERVASAAEKLSIFFSD